jgi:DNA (cytosine-5)-methyltransferase 1
MTLLAFDFFCGAGGLTRGLLDAGINVVTGLDKDERCKQTFEENNHDVVFAAADIQYIDVEDLKKLTEIDAFENFLFAACAP